MTVTIEDIRQARHTIAGSVENTPFLHARKLSDLLAAEIHLKLENLQYTGSFKDRGALNRMMSLGQEERARGVIAMSAGNHAQAVAYHAQRLGIPATIVMPRWTPFVKVRRTAQFGARIMLEGETLGEAGEAAHGIARQEGLTFVHPYDDDLVVAGQGTIALEMLEEVPDLDMLVVPVGGGGLIGGMAVAAKSLRPDITVIGVEAALYPSLEQTLRGEEPVCGGTTIAEGIAVKHVGERPLAIARQYVDGLILVKEAELERAIFLLLTQEKIVAEGSGAAGLAALLAEPDRFRGRKVGMPVCGGNIDPRLLSTVIQRELMRVGQIARISVQVADTPGQLARATAIIADFGCSVLDVIHDRMSLEMPAKHTAIDFVIEARDGDQVRQILGRMRQEGLNAKLAGMSEAEQLVPSPADS